MISGAPQPTDMFEGAGTVRDIRVLSTSRGVFSLYATH